jgi:cyanophycin synthetase
MEFLQVLALRGPNFWSRRTVLEAWVDLQDLKDSPSDKLPGLYERLTAWLPGLIEHRCGVGERGGFLQRLRDGTYPAHILEHVTIELENLAGTPVGFGKARETSRPGVYKVAVRYREEQVGRACLLAARELLLAAIHDRPYDLAAETKRLRVLADDVCLGPSTNAIVAAASARGIPVRRLSEGSLVQLGYGVRQRRIWTAETDRTSAIAESIAQDKDLTKTLLRAGGVPVPRGRAAESAADAWAAASEIGVPVVVKPRDGNHGRAVFTELATQQQIETAYACAADEGSGVIVEQFIQGNEHRLLVVGERLVAAARGEAAWVVGDGRLRVTELIESQLNTDPRRGDTDEFPLSPVELDNSSRLHLSRQGLTPESVPPLGTRVLIQRNGNVAFDVTDQVHPTIAAEVVLAARIVGLDIAGIDVVAEDIARPLEEQRGAVIEVNSSPGLHMHLMPASGTPRPVGEAIIDVLYPTPGANGRIPVVCVTGTNGKTIVSRLVAEMLRSSGRRVGLACSDGVYIGSRALERGDCAGPKSARRVLQNPVVETAVLEAGRGGILREGLGFDQCDVAVVTNIGEADHLGRHFVETPEDMFSVKRCPVDVVLPTGTAVLKADDPLVADMARLSAGRVTFFAQEPEHPVVVAHRRDGKRAVFVRGGQIVLADGATETPLVALADVPMTHRGCVAFQIDNALAAVAAGWALNLDREQLRQALVSFKSDAGDAPGRFNMIERHGVTAVVDDCHNPAALGALIAALDGFPHSKRAVVFSAGAGRRDADIVRQGEKLAAAFDRVFLYDDASAYDRQPGELTRLLRQGLASGGRVTDIIAVPAYKQAVLQALASAAAGELVVIQTEDSGTGASVDAVVAWAQQGARREGTGGFVS